MGEQKELSGTDATLAADSARPPSGADATIAADSARPPSGADETLASGAGAPSGPAIVKSGAGKAAYRDLTSVDPKHYVVGDEIARGGMGRIFAAHDRRLDRPVAIKELLVRSPGLLRRFEREAKITARLQHPAIVSIHEAGVWPTGEPFFAMKLVAGKPLDKVVEKASALRDRLSLLPNVIAAVDALAYAHDRRIVHRDLKPGNMLIGDFGETVVIDWGLAKDLNDTAEESMDVSPYRLGDGEQTVAGSVLGTPAYMPVEQALGEKVDERADVYALGAILYHCLAGRAPYAGRTAEEVLANVIAGSPSPLGEVAPGVPLDLLTIVGKAMAREAANRYPTAKELADDLKKFQTGQLVSAHAYTPWQLVRRWAGRHRLALIVATAAVVVLAVFGVVTIRRIFEEQAATERQRQDAVAARTVAEQRGAEAEKQRLVAVESRAKAEALVNFMLTDVAEQLHSEGKIGLLGSVAERVQAYYADQPHIADDLERWRRGLVLLTLGEVAEANGDLPLARTRYEEAYRLVEPSDNDLDESVVLGKLADAIDRQGDSAASLPLYKKRLEIAEKNYQKDTKSTAWSAERMWASRDIGLVHAERGDHAAALVEFEHWLSIQKFHAGRMFADDDMVRLHHPYNAIANALRAKGELARALETRDLALKTVRDLAKEAPAYVVNRYDLSVTLLGRGKDLAALGRKAEAVAALREALELATRVSTDNPSVTKWRYHLANVHLALAEHVAGELARHASAAKEIAAELVQRVPKDVAYQRVVERAEAFLENSSK